MPARRGLKWEELRLVELKEECRSRGLKISGRKEELVERLRHHGGSKKPIQVAKTTIQPKKSSTSAPPKAQATPINEVACDSAPNAHTSEETVLMHAIPESVQNKAQETASEFEGTGVSNSDEAVVMQPEIETGQDKVSASAADMELSEVHAPHPPELQNEAQATAVRLDDSAMCMVTDTPNMNTSSVTRSVDQGVSAGELDVSHSAIVSIGAVAVVTTPTSDAEPSNRLEGETVQEHGVVELDAQKMTGTMHGAEAAVEEKNNQVPEAGPTNRSVATKGSHELGAERSRSPYRSTAAAVLENEGRRLAKNPLQDETAAPQFCAATHNRKAQEARRLLETALLARPSPARSVCKLPAASPRGLAVMPVPTAAVPASPRASLSAAVPSSPRASPSAAVPSSPRPSPRFLDMASVTPRRATIHHEENGIPSSPAAIQSGLLPSPAHLMAPPSSPAPSPRDGNKRHELLEQLTKNLQVCIQKSRSPHLDACGQDKYRSMIESIRKQIDSLSVARSPLASPANRTLSPVISPMPHWRKL